jgi:hypothetical protein
MRPLGIGRRARRGSPGARRLHDAAALLSLGAVLVLVTFGHLLKEPLYEFHTHVIPRLALLAVVLLLPREDDVISADGFLRSARRRA